MKHTICAIAGVLVLGCMPALAADLGRAPVYKAPPAPYVPQNWTGCYLGVNIGGGWTSISAFNVTGVGVGSKTRSGVAGGGQLGCDYQFAGNWVLGIQGMLDGTSISGDDSLGLVHGSVPWFATITGRLGYSITPTVLVYGKGGAAFTHDKLSLIGTAASWSTDPSGWTAGGGVEWMFAPRWSTFLEYDYMGFGSKSGAFSDGTLASFHQNVQAVLVGLNYRFVP